ncbi:hypothetical protein EC396_13390 [Lutibacter sp. HS1-25]|uniref:hypothetical protein n=1 Tax=Lutibacter sp. HS1-25 TaxID=2485000 RepID=UPI0010114537|nr:hypothetical protein [Lutibacter sp. HS1-25]RXP46868.1 hypothetical protein EC396_13390 [Lutibacter sp. HS1-25]
MKKIIFLIVLSIGLTSNSQEIKLDTSKSIYTSTGGWHDIVEYDNGEIIFFFKEMEYNHDYQSMRFLNKDKFNLFLEYLIKVDETKDNVAITNINEYYPQTGGILYVMKSGNATTVIIENIIEYRTLIRKGLASKIYKKINE